MASKSSQFHAKSVHLRTNRIKLKNLTRDGILRTALSES
jgi:hypothetical protein